VKQGKMPNLLLDRLNSPPAKTYQLMIMKIAIIAKSQVTIVTIDDMQFIILSYPYLATIPSNIPDKKSLNTAVYSFRRSYFSFQIIRYILIFFANFCFS
jgi:hypothetical protein